MNTCQNCGNTYEGKFCNQCGEKLFSPTQNTFIYVMGEIFHFFTHFDSKYFKTLKTILLSPATYTLDYCKGIRVNYYKPVPFLILTIVIYLINPFKFDGLNSRLDNQLQVTGFSELKSEIMQNVMQKKAVDLKEYHILYAEKSLIVSKVLIILFIPVWWIYISLVSLILGKRKTVFENFVGSIEMKSFYIWVFYMLIIYFELPFILIFGENSLLMQYIAVIPALIYGMLFFRNYLGIHWLVALAFGGGLQAIEFLLLPYYRLILFYITNQLI
jgi:hypothetical protein